MPSSVHPVVCYGEALWTILPTGKQAGGSPVRIAGYLQQLGMNPAVVSRIGFDDLGRELIEELEAKKISTDYFQMDETKPTGVSTAYVQDGYETIYTIYNDVAWDVIEYTDELSELLSGAGFFVYGSLSARCRESRSTLVKLLSVARTKVLHLNLCAPFYNRTLIEELLMQADIAVLTGEELELITGWFSDYKEETDRIQTLQCRFNIQMAAVVNGQEGFMLATKNTLYKQKDFGSKIKNNEAGSEAFLAGLLVKSSAGSSPEETLAYAASIASSVFSDKTMQHSYYENDKLPYINRLHKE